MNTTSLTFGFVDLHGLNLVHDSVLHNSRSKGYKLEFLVGDKSFQVEKNPSLVSSSILRF
jgi:hypothetical protein